MENLDIHVALIPDGNRRWAKKRGFLPWIGHQAGAKMFNQLIDKILELGIMHFTFWGASYDNLTKRNPKEVSVLLDVMHTQFSQALKNKKIDEYKVHIEFLGKWKEIVPEKTQKVFQKLMDKTKDYNGRFFNLLIAYNGDDEMQSCIQEIANEAQKSSDPVKVTPELIKSHLWVKKSPEIDFIIRTGSGDDPHNSTGFMMWQTAYSQFYFTKTLFPDFTPSMFEEAIKDFLVREKRKGK